MIRFIILGFIVFFCNITKADTVITPTVMSNVLYKKTNSDSFEYVNEYETLTDLNYYVKSLNLGALVRHNNFHVTLTSNRFFNNTTEREVEHKQTKVRYINREELINDTLGLGYLVNKYNIAVIFANVNMKNELFYNNSIVSESESHDIVKGLSFGKYVNDKTLVSLTYFEGSQDLNLAYAVSFNIFYSFNNIF